MKDLVESGLKEEKNRSGCGCGTKQEMSGARAIESLFEGIIPKRHCCGDGEEACCGEE